MDLVQILNRTTATAWSAPLFVLKKIMNIFILLFQNKKKHLKTFVLKQAHIFSQHHTYLCCDLLIG